jgi:hypothetical protein
MFSLNALVASERSRLLIGQKRASRKPRLAQHLTAACFLQADF